MFVMDNSLTCRTVYNEPLLRLTQQDQVHYRRLMELRSSGMARSRDRAVGATDKGEGSSDEHSFARWVLTGHLRDGLAGQTRWVLALTAAHIHTGCLRVLPLV